MSLVHNGGLSERAAAIKALPDLSSRLRAAADALWAVYGDPAPSADRATVSWIGFYEIARPGNTHGGEPGAAMILGPCRDKPACSPIGLHGACGQSFTRRETLIVTDVAHLGAGYVACDPRDKSELVIPLFDEQGHAWGVLDADSFAVNAFDAADADAMERFCVAAGLTAGRLHPAARRVV